jgi:integrase/recombinase XerD
VANREGLTKNVSPHGLRHTFATTALQKGISLPTVQKILGHNRLQTTAIYLNFTNVHIQVEFRPSRSCGSNWLQPSGGSRSIT